MTVKERRIACDEMLSLGYANVEISHKLEMNNQSVSSRRKRMAKYGIKVKNADERRYCKRGHDLSLPRAKSPRKESSSKTGFKCRECKNLWERNNRSKKSSLEKALSTKKAAHKVDEAIYFNILKDQNGGCGICGRTDPGRKGTSLLFVDHDHVTGKVRGLLCQPCNMGLGGFKDDVMSLENAISYLEITRDPHGPRFMPIKS